MRSPSSSPDRNTSQRDSSGRWRPGRQHPGCQRPGCQRPGWLHRGRQHPGRQHLGWLAIAVGVAVALAGTLAGVVAAAVPSGHPAAGVGRPAAAHAGAGASQAGERRAVAAGGTAHAPAAGSGGGSPAGAMAKAVAGRRTAAAHPAAKAAAATHATAARGAAARGAAARGAADRSGPQPPRTSCRSVAHIGDSTSVDLISPGFLPDPAERLGARYAAAGVRHLRIDASGGRSIVEEMPGQINGYKVASAWRGLGYHGCWALALGTNDAANVAAGSAVGMRARIDQMMSVAHGQPVLWVNVRTLLPSGDWASANERAWDETLLKALASYPNMRIFDWSAVARPGWFLPDGIHYNTLGCAIRARAIAGALTRAFPLHGHSAGKIVR